MANLVFKYGAMNSGKTLNILQTIHSYEENNLKICLIKSIKDTKGENFIVSRNGFKRQVDILLKENESLLKEEFYKIYYTSKCIVVDEVEMLNNSQIEELWTIAHLINIPVISYGLKSNFKADIFSDGVEKLIAMADEIEEIGSTSLCMCGKKATFNARKVDDSFTCDGPVIMIEDGKTKNMAYVPLCSDCYLKYVKINGEKVKELSNLVNLVK